MTLPGGIEPGFGAVERLKDIEAMRDFVDALGEGYYCSSIDGRQLMASRALVSLNRCESEEQLIAGIHDIAVDWYVDPDRRSQFSEILEREGSVRDFVSQMRPIGAPDEVVWISENARIVRGEDGEALWYEGTVRDITDTMRRLELEERHAAMDDHLPGVLMQWRYSAEGHATLPFASSGFEQMFGLPFDSVRDDARDALRLLHRADAANYERDVKRSYKSQTVWEGTYRIVRPDGTIVWLSVSAKPRMEADGACTWYGFVSDVTEQKQTAQHIHELAFFDPLTGLGNRRSLMDALKETVERIARDGGHGAMMAFDVDDFRTLNDTRGHRSGDAFLQELSGRMNGCIADLGTLYRFGGDQFFVVLNNLDADPERANAAARCVAHCIREAAGTVFELNDGPFHTTITGGVALFDASETVTCDLLRNADTALHHAKSDGKNRIAFYDRGMHAALDRSVVVMNELRAAIAQGELELHYQMQNDCNGRIVGAEALLRWRHPVRGMIPPGEFVPDAEETGLIVPVTRWVLGEAVKTLARWRHDPALRQIKLSINISARQFHDDLFVRQVRELLEVHDVDPRCLQLEMTEHVLTGNTDRVRDVMMQLKALGVSFSLDDFGTGYSSLTHLRDLPFDEVKIDGKFVAELERNSADRALVSSIVAMASALGLTTVAEWVETGAQRRILVETGCVLLQGFLFGPAVRLAVFEQAVRDAPAAANGIQQLQQALEEAGMATSVA
ncbi:EAL domain-containing protein [Rhizobiaceae bacterium]|nr:EAL domain-containing protein [Rhizobiaceae bacterium]